MCTAQPTSISLLHPALMMLHPAAIRPSLAKGTVNFVGDPVVVVVAESRALAMDAAELVEIDYEPLGAVVDMEDALAPDSPRPVRVDRAATSFIGLRSGSEDPLAGADVVVQRSLREPTAWPSCRWRGARSPSIRPAPISTSPCTSPARCRTWCEGSSPGCWAWSRSGCGSSRRTSVVLSAPSTCRPRGSWRASSPWSSADR